jgi:hypothetical protein
MRQLLNVALNLFTSNFVHINKSSVLKLMASHKNSKIHFLSEFIKVIKELANCRVF